MTSSRPWLLIIDNCGNHANLNWPGVRMTFVLMRCTASHRPWDEGIISQTEIRYRGMLLRETIEISLTFRNEHSDFRSTGRERWGLRQGKVPNLGHAMRVMDQYRSFTTPS